MVSGRLPLLAAILIASALLTPLSTGVAGAQPAVMVVGPTPSPPVDILVWLGGFEPYDIVEVWLSTGASKTLLATLYLGSTGEGIEMVGLPRDLGPGLYTLEFQALSGLSTTATVEVVEPSLTLDKSQAAVGELVTAEAEGLGGGGVSYAYQLRVAGVTVAVLFPGEDGRASASFPLPPLPSGVYTVELVYTPPVWVRFQSVYGGEAVLATAEIEVVEGVATLGEARAIARRWPRPTSPPWRRGSAWLSRLWRTSA
ncbi:hypothetical protein [Aeropyrum camini]|uniref:hypothetical protein n=1 Tax=Aeropyrum camini TaxID=229980 RepID=UPI0012E2D41C|nr:hypothetical protein [Aeropyrum camini]